MKARDHLRAVAQRLAGGADADFEPLLGIFRRVEVARREHLVEPTEPFNRIFFVHEGLFRIYYSAPRGRQYTKSFFPEASFGGLISGIYGIETSGVGLEALEPSVVLVASVPTFAELIERHPEHERLARRFYEALLVTKEQRERELLTLSAPERLRAFNARYPGLERRITQAHLASYLGVTEEYLSRLLSRPIGRS